MIANHVRIGEPVERVIERAKQEPVCWTVYPATVVRAGKPRLTVNACNAEDALGLAQRIADYLESATTLQSNEVMK